MRSRRQRHFSRKRRMISISIARLLQNFHQGYVSISKSILRCSRSTFWRWRDRNAVQPGRTERKVGLRRAVLVNGNGALGLRLGGHDGPVRQVARRP